MIEHVFALGYRRLEWKCDALMPRHGGPHSGSAFSSKVSLVRTVWSVGTVEILLGILYSIANGNSCDR